MSEIATNISNRIDQLEAALIADFPEVDCKLHHEFTPGLYTREIFMPEDTLVVSRIHKTRHPYIILAGVVHVKINDGEWQRIEAPYRGITEPGTRRVLYIEENTAWVTFHATDVMPENDSYEALIEAVEKVDEQILEQHVNPILDGELKNNYLIKNQLHVQE